MVMRKLDQVPIWYQKTYTMKLQVVDDFNPKAESLKTENYLHYTYLHSKIDEARGCDLQCVVVDSVGEENLWTNYIRNYKRGINNSYKVYTTDKEGMYKVGPNRDPRVEWFEVDVVDYPGECVCIRKEWIDMILLDKKKCLWYPNLRHSGVIVDVDEYEEGFRYILDHVYDGGRLDPELTLEKLCSQFKLWLWAKRKAKG